MLGSFETDGLRQDPELSMHLPELPQHRHEHGTGKDGTQGSEQGKRHAGLLGGRWCQRGDSLLARFRTVALKDAHKMRVDRTANLPGLCT
jgi:hypothetical protein